MECAKIILKYSNNTNRAYQFRYESTNSRKRNKKVNPEVLEAIRIFSRLLSALGSHVLSMPNNSTFSLKTAPPYQFSENKIGNIDINEIEENDDKRWLALIYMLACNMQWLAMHMSYFY